MKNLSKFIFLLLLFFAFPLSLSAGNAVNDTYIINQNTILNANVLDNDSGSAKEVNRYWVPSNGTINSFNSDGNFQYQPNSNYVGNDKFQYEMKFKKNTKWGWKWKYKTATVYIVIEANHIAPIITPETFSVNAKSSDGTLVGQVQTNPLATTFEILSGDIDSIFTIDNSGNITVSNIITANATSYSLSVKATNTYGNDTETIIVNLVNETEYLSGTIKFDRINPDDTVNIIGNTQIIGNTVQCVTTTGYALSADYSNLTCNDTAGNYNNNNYTIKYLTIDSTKINSSSATLQLPDSFDKVAWVGLFWQGNLNNESVIYKKNGSTYKSNDYPNGGIKDTDANKVQFKINNNSYQDIIADKLHYLGGNYAAFTNVTKLFTNYMPNSNVNITIANIATTRGRETGLGNYGAWTLVMVYKEDELNSQSKLRNNSVYEGYKVIAKNKPDSIDIKDYLLPKKGAIDSRMAVFAAEGEYRYKPDTMTLDGTPLGDPDSDNVFDARLSSSILRTPLLEYNNNGIDIDVFDTSAIMKAKRDADPTATSYNSKISLTSNQDTYLPSMVSFTTELYKPRVCYYIDTISDSSGNIFENAAFIDGKDIESGKKYTFNFLIANMKKNIGDTDIEIAKKVQVYLNMNNFNYESGSTEMYNIGETQFNPITDINATALDPTTKDDKGEYSNNQSTWRLGQGASNLIGGELDLATDFTDMNNIVRVKLIASLTTSEGADTIDLLDFIEFKASFQTSSITIGEDNAQLISQCQDLSTSGNVGIPPNGSYNAVEIDFSASIDPLNTATTIDPKNYINTKVVNKQFTLSILSLDHATNTILTNSTTDVNVSVITSPVITGVESIDLERCHTARTLSIIKTVKLDSLKRKDVNLTALVASQDASIRITYEEGKSICSRDIFAVRPNKFVISSPIGEDIQLLKSGNTFFFGLLAPEYGNNNPSFDYNITTANTVLNNGNLDANKTVYNPDNTVPTPKLLGTLQFKGVNFDFSNGATIAGISFSDVGKVNIKVIDTNWSKVDLEIDDTVADCSANGAYVCGDINATFIPDHFKLTNANLFNTNASTYTYLGSDLNLTAGMSLTIAAVNSANATTLNFTANSWEKPVDVSFTLPATGITGLVENKSDINTTSKLGFAAGTYTINSTDTNTSANLVFNYNRSKNNPENPFMINGAGISLNAVSTYTSTTPVSPTSPVAVVATVSPDQNATFIYGRTHATRHRFNGNSGTAFIYYEAYCSGTVNANPCDKTLLPNSSNSKFTDDPRWFINSSHIASSGVSGGVTQKGSTYVHGTVTPGNPASAAISYTGSAYPYKATMQNTPSSWLVYDKYKINPTANEFEVEFVNTNSKWAGKNDTNTTTINSATDRTNRRSMW